MLLQEERYRTNATIHIDRIRILQVLSNPIDNAIKFTPAGARRRPGRNLTAITFGQQRTGNPEDYQEKIFEIPTSRRPATPGVAPISA
jgi:signal transduction histidine kinase